MREAWAILSRTGGIVPIVNPEDGTPCGLITGLSLINYMSEYVGPHPRSQEMRIAELLELPSKEACDTNVPRFLAGTRIRDVLTRILREEHNEFLIVDENGVYLGVSRQRDVLNPPRMRIILVDHNEPGQALGALEEAELVEILDHHRLGNMSTHIPIRFSVDIVGSTSTLVSERIEEAGLSSPPEIAGLLLAGLLSDTLILSSPTTTDRDKHAAERLGRWAFVHSSPLAGETIDSFGDQVVNAGAGLAAREPEDVVNTDLKMYEAGIYKFAIAQVEVTDLLLLAELQDELIVALKYIKRAQWVGFFHVDGDGCCGKLQPLVDGECSSGFGRSTLPAPARWYPHCEWSRIAKETAVTHSIGFIRGISFGSFPGDLRINLTQQSRCIVHRCAQQWFNTAPGWSKNACIC